RSDGLRLGALLPLGEDYAVGVGRREQRPSINSLAGNEITGAGIDLRSQLRTVVRRIEVREHIASIRDGGQTAPTHSKVQREAMRDLPVILKIDFAVNEVQVGSDIRQGLGEGCHVAEQEVAPVVKAEARLAVDSIFGLDHLLDLEAGTQSVFAQVKREVVEVRTVEVALLPRRRSGIETGDAGDGDSRDLAVGIRRPLVGELAV